MKRTVIDRNQSRSLRPFVAAPARPVAAGPLAAALLLATLIQLPLIAAGQMDVDRPVIAIEPEQLDFGKMKQNESRLQTVTIRNIGGALLRIREVRADCGCTVPEIKEKELEPGQSTILDINFNSKKFQGEVTKYVRIYSNDPDTPALEYPILANVEVPLEIHPGKKSLALGRVPVGSVGSAKAWFSTKDVPDLEIKPVRFNEKLFAVTVQPDPEGRSNKAIMEVTSLPDAPVGRHREFIRVETNVPDMAFVDFEAFLEVLQDLEAQPHQVNFRYAQRDKEMTYQVRVRPTAGELEFKITGAEIDLPGFTTEVVETVPNKETSVYISGLPLPTSDPRAIKAKGRMTGTLRIFTNLESQPELTVPVRYLLKM